VTLAAALALAGSALAVLARLYPRPAVAHLAMACGLGFWVALAQAALGGAIETATDLGAAVAGYSLVLLALGEAARAVALRRKPVDPRPDPEFAAAAPWRVGPLFGGALPDFLLGLTGAAVGLTAWGWTVGPETVFTLAAGSAAVLGASRARRAEPVVGVGLWLAVFSAMSLTAWRLGWADAGFTLGALALTASACAVALWAAGRAAWGELYSKACFRAVAWLSWVVLGLALVGRVFSLKAYPLSAAALGVSASALLLLTIVRPRPGLTYRAIVSAVLGVYVVIFSVGRASPETAHVPGLIAVVLALGLQGLGFAGRARPREGWERLYLTPLFRSALVLATLGIASAYWSPAAMILAGLVFLAMVKGLPSRLWIYATVALWCVALYHGYLVRLPQDRLVTAAMVVAYQLWLVGLLVRRAEPALVRWLGLPQTGYDGPLLHSAVAAAAVAVALRVFETFDGSVAWTDSAGLAWNLAGFALLMTKAYPRAAWVHAAVVLASTGVVMAAFPHVERPVWWLPLGMALAIGWQASARGVRSAGAWLRRWLDVERADYARTFDVWSRAFFTITTSAVAALVAGGVLLSAFEVSGVAVVTSAREWGAVLLTIGLAAVFVAAAWWLEHREEAVMGLMTLLVLAVWWLGAPVSPLPARVGLTGGTFLPPATAAMALGSVAAGVGLVRRPGWRGAFWHRAGDDDEPRARLDAYAVQLGFALALVASALTLGRTRPDAVAALVVASGALGLAAAARRWVASGYAAGLVGCAAGLSAALEAARRLGVTSGADRVVLAALGLLAAVAALWALAGLLRRREPGAAAGGEPSDLPAGSVAVALEQVALLAAVFCAAGVVSTVLFPTRPADRVAWAGVGVLAALTVMAVGLLRRWGAAWLVYAAQAALLGSYLYYRWAFPIPAAADAVVLTLFGYLDFGLAEAMHRVGLGRFAGPTRRFAMAVPLVPLVLAFWGGPLGEAKLFLLFAAATFYGVACARLQSRPVGYAAAVLYNAALWVLWSQIGWTLTDRPQFFLVPVGLSTVLFAEVNRGTFPREALNAIRGVGLTLTYLSLAVPVWQFESLGAWLALLLLSLAGVFAGIGLRVQTFLWLGLATFVLDVVYQLGRVGMENAVAKWVIMLALGILLVLFVALSEKKRIVTVLRGYYETARTWE
jgi:hypothetical protein